MGIIRVLKQEKCFKCEKIVILAKVLCSSCYKKKIRNTPEGKLKAKLYYDTVARQRFLDKNPKKEPKEKKLCECGKISIAKNMCRNCYQKKRGNPNYIYKPRKIKLVNVTDEFDLSIKICDKNTGKYCHKARAGQSKTKQFAILEINEYIKFNSDFGDCNYLSVESKVLNKEDYFDCKPIYIDMNKIYRY